VYDFKAKFWLSSLIAGLLGILNMQYALAFWQGNRFLHSGELGVAQIMTVLMSAMVSAPRGS
jgi:ATP-binding cassette subfamily B (MDR/TAP) protein 1